MSPRLIRQDQAYDRLAKKYGLATSKQLRAGPARYHWDLIERDIKALLLRRRDLPNGCKGTYPKSLVNYAASMFLTCCMLEKRPLLPELVHLIWQQLDVKNFGIKKGEKQNLIVTAQQICSEERSISNRQLAKRIRVPTATIGRWVESGLLPEADPAEGVAE
jgi:hypothetical protein